MPRYYLDKGDRGFEHKIYLLGADHHGYVHRLKALAGAAGDEPERDIEVLIGQLVSINGAKLSSAPATSSSSTTCRPGSAPTRCGTRSPATRPTRRSRSTPRSCSAARTTTPCSTCSTRTRAPPRSTATRHPSASTARRSRPSCSTHETESALLGALQEFPRIVAQAAELREPHRVARYIEELAGLYHRWYDNCRVLPLGDEPIGDLHRTRLWLNDATGQVLRNGLDLLGVSAPERM